MKIILRQDFEKLGKIGDVVEVSDGYGRNFILPKKIGFMATEGNLRAFEEEELQRVQRDKPLSLHKIYFPKRHGHYTQCIICPYESYSLEH